MDYVCHIAAERKTWAYSGGVINMLGVEFRALCFIRGKFHLMDGTCLVGSDIK